MDKIISIKFALETLKRDSIRCPNAEDGVKHLMKKYGILFLGENLNRIYSHELCVTLKNKFGLEIEMNELNEIIPSICKSLHMACEPILDVTDYTDLNPFEYQITLFKQ